MLYLSNMLILRQMRRLPTIFGFYDLKVKILCTSFSEEADIKGMLRIGIEYSNKVP